MHMAQCYPAACTSSTDLLPAVAHGNWSSEIQLNNNAHRTGGGGKTQVKKFTYAGGLSIRPFPTQGREVSPLHVHYCSPKNPILPFREIQEELSDVKSSFPSSCFQPKYCFHWKTCGGKNLSLRQKLVLFVFSRCQWSQKDWRLPRKASSFTAD